MGIVTICWIINPDSLNTELGLTSPPSLPNSYCGMRLRNELLTNQRWVMREPHGHHRHRSFFHIFFTGEDVSLLNSQIFVKIDKVWAVLTWDYTTKSCLDTTEVVPLTQAAVRIEKGKNWKRPFCSSYKKMRHAVPSRGLINLFLFYLPTWCLVTLRFLIEK